MNHSPCHILYIIIIDLFMNHSHRHANYFSGHTQLIAAHGKPIDTETAQVIKIYY